MKKLFSLAIIATFILALLSACSGGSSKAGELEPLGKDEKAKIKVMFWDEQFFFQEYGNLFASKFPDIEIEVASTQSIYNDQSSDLDKAFQKFIDEKKPDVLMLQEDLYEKYAGAGKLLALDPVIKQDDYKTDGMHPGILQFIRDKGNGKLYGLSPNFSSGAIFYNIDLFKQYGVDLPQDSMSWEEVFELAKRFPTDGAPDKRVYGFTLASYNTLENLIMTIGASQDLKTLNSDASQVTINTDSWKKVFHTTMDAVKSGAIYLPSDKDREFKQGMSMEDMYMKNVFVSGRAAMTYNFFYLAEDLKQARETLKKVKPVNWGIVTSPVDPKNRTQSSDITVDTIFSVNAASPNQRAAWEFIKYINSEDFAKIKSKSQYGNLLTWTAYNMDQDGRKMEPFYKLQPKSGVSSEFMKAPSKFFNDYRQVVKSEVDAVLGDKLTVEEALKSIQEKAQEQLIKAKKEAEAVSPSPTASAS